MLSPNRWLWIGSIALILSFAIPIVSDTVKGLEWMWPWDGWKGSTYGGVFARLLAPVLGVVVLALIRPVRSTKRGITLLVITSMFVAWHYVAKESSVSLWIRFGLAETSLDSHEPLAAYLLVGLAAVVAGQALPTRLLLACGGLWLLTSFALPHGGGEPIGTTFYESDWRQMWPALTCLTTIASIGLAAVLGMKRIARWLLLGLAVAGPVLFVYQLTHLSSELDLWRTISAALRAVCLYYGFIMLLASGLVASRSNAPS